MDLIFKEIYIKEPTGKVIIGMEMQSVNKHQLVTKSVLIGLVKAISYLTETPIVDLNITFDDSVFRSLQSEREQDMKDLALGVMTKEEYRAKWYGETVEQAKKNLPEEEEPIMGYT